MDGEAFGISPEMLQNPLVIALGVSPLFLLVNRPLTNLAVGKKRVFEVRGTHFQLHERLLNLNAITALESTREQTACDTHKGRKTAVENIVRYCLHERSRHNSRDVAGSIS